MNPQSQGHEGGPGSKADREGGHGRSKQKHIMRSGGPKTAILTMEKRLMKRLACCLMIMNAFTAVSSNVLNRSEFCRTHQTIDFC